MQLSDIYQEVILDHYKKPRNKGRLNEADLRLELHNPTCGDIIEVTATVGADERITDVKFTGTGCSISQASASMMTEMVKGKTKDEARELGDQFRAMMKGEPGDWKPLGQLQALQGVSKYPVRVKCATLAWNVLKEAMDGKPGDDE